MQQAAGGWHTCSLARSLCHGDDGALRTQKRVSQDKTNSCCHPAVALYALRLPEALGHMIEPQYTPERSSQGALYAQVPRLSDVMPSQVRPANVAMERHLETGCASCSGDFHGDLTKDSSGAGRPAKRPRHVQQQRQFQSYQHPYVAVEREAQLKGSMLLQPARSSDCGNMLSSWPPSQVIAYPAAADTDYVCSNVQPVRDNGIAVLEGMYNSWAGHKGNLGSFLAQDDPVARLDARGHPAVTATLGECRTLMQAWSQCDRRVSGALHAPTNSQALLSQPDARIHLSHLHMQAATSGMAARPCVPSLDSQQDGDLQAWACALQPTLHHSSHMSWRGTAHNSLAGHGCEDTSARLAPLYTASSTSMQAAMSHPGHAAAAVLARPAVSQGASRGFPGGYGVSVSAVAQAEHRLGQQSLAFGAPPGFPMDQANHSCSACHDAMQQYRHGASQATMCSSTRHPQQSQLQPAQGISWQSNLTHGTVRQGAPSVLARVQPLCSTSPLPSVTVPDCSWRFACPSGIHLLQAHNVALLHPFASQQQHLRAAHAQQPLQAPLAPPLPCAASSQSVDVMQPMLRTVFDQSSHCQPSVQQTTLHTSMHSLVHTQPMQLQLSWPPVQASSFCDVQPQLAAVPVMRLALSHAVPSSPHACTMVDAGVEACATAYMSSRLPQQARRALSALPWATPVPSPPAPSAQDLICSSLFAFGFSSPRTLELALHCWSRVSRLPSFFKSLSQWPSIEAGTRCYVVVVVWLSAKLEEKRRDMPGARVLSRLVGVSAASIGLLEVQLLQWLDWSPYLGLVSNEASDCFLEYL